MLWYCDSFSLLKLCLFQTGKSYILFFTIQQYVLPHYSYLRDPRLCTFRSTPEYPTLIFSSFALMLYSVYLISVFVSLLPVYRSVNPLLSACLELRAYPKFICLYSMWNLSYKIIVLKFFNFLWPLKVPLQCYSAPLHSSREVGYDCVGIPLHLVGSFDLLIFPQSP